MVLGTMAGVKNVLENEKYMNDVVSTIFSQLKEAARRKTGKSFNAYDNVPHTGAFTTKSEVQNNDISIYERKLDHTLETKSIDNKAEKMKVKEDFNSIYEIKDAKMNNLNKKLGHSHKAEHLATSVLSKQNIFLHSKEKKYLCIKVEDMKGDKNFEFISVLSDFIRVKNAFPKLLEIIPDVDSACKKIDYSAEAVNIIFGFVFNHSLNYSAISSPVIGIEVLVAAQFWEIHNFYEIFIKIFLQKVLTPNNVSSIFSLACQFDLKEVCDACKNISPDITELALKKVKKSCFISITTYVEPLEFSIPFFPVVKSFSTTFERHVQNKIIFKAILGTYAIKGIQVQLNENHLKENGDSELNVDKELEIDYSIRNTSNNQNICNQIVKKPVRPINVIYFKKSLIVKPGEVGEIIVETDTLPYLCSCSKKGEKEEKDSGKFELIFHSNSPIRSYEEKLYLFLVGKLLYVKEK